MLNEDLLVRNQNALEKLASSFGFDLVIEFKLNSYFITESLDNHFIFYSDICIGNDELQAKEYLQVLLTKDYMAEVNHNGH